MLQLETFKECKAFTADRFAFILPSWPFFMYIYIQRCQVLWCSAPRFKRLPPFCASAIEINVASVDGATARRQRCVRVGVIYQSGASEEAVDSPPLMVHSSSPIKTGSVLPYRCVVGGEASVTNLCRGAARSFVLPVTVAQVFNHRGGLMCGAKGGNKEFGFKKWDFFFKKYIFYIFKSSIMWRKKKSGSTAFLKMKFLFSFFKKKNVILSFGSAKTLKSIYCDSSIFFSQFFCFLKFLKNTSNFTSLSEKTTLPNSEM